MSDGNDNKGLSYDMITELLNKRDAEEKKDRRQKRDWISKMATILSLCAWCIMIAVWVIIETASPDREMMFINTFFEAQFGVAGYGRSRWNYSLVYAAYILMLVSMGACAIAFILNKMRMKRKSDKYKVSIFVIGGITVIAFIAFMIRFGSVLF